MRNRRMLIVSVLILLLPFLIVGCGTNVGSVKAASNYLVILYSGGKPVHYWWQSTDAIQCGSFGNCGPLATDSGWAQGTYVEEEIPYLTEKIVDQYNLQHVPSN